MRFLIALLALAGLIDSALALRIHLQDPNAAPPCAVSEKWDCGSVNHGRYSVFPATSFDEDTTTHHIHIPVAIFGIAGYAVLAILALARRYSILLPLAVIGCGFAGYLTYLEAYVMEKWCIYCVWSQAIIAAILLTTIAALLLQRRERRYAHSAVIAA